MLEGPSFLGLRALANSIYLLTGERKTFDCLLLWWRKGTADLLIEGGGKIKPRSVSGTPLFYHVYLDKVKASLH